MTGRGARHHHLHRPGGLGGGRMAGNGGGWFLNEFLWKPHVVLVYGNLMQWITDSMSEWITNDTDYMETGEGRGCGVG